jgi:hypothetical protein
MIDRRIEDMQSKRFSYRQRHVFALVARAQRFWLSATVTVLSGCTNAPSISILGAFFPAWMLCIIAGIVLTLVLRGLLLAVGLDEHVGPRGVIYPAAVVLLTLVTWMTFFEN